MYEDAAAIRLCQHGGKEKEKEALERLGDAAQ